jgi:hypothetical protein
MKKQLHILKGHIILILILLSSLLLISFIYKILHQPVDTTYIWNINLTNLKVKEGSKTGNISLKDNKVELDLTLEKEKEYYEFSFDIENTGTKDAILEEYNLEVDNQKNILTYNISYLNNTPINKGDVLSNNSTQTIKVRIDYPKQEKKVYDKLNIKISLNLKYIEK